MIDLEDQIRIVLNSQAEAMHVPDAVPAAARISMDPPSRRRREHLRRDGLRRPRGMALAVLSTVLVATLVGGLWWIANRPALSNFGPLPETALTEGVGRYYLPTGLPDAYRVLAVREYAGDRPVPTAPRALYRDSQTGALVDLYEAAPADRWPDDSAGNVVQLPSATARLQTLGPPDTGSETQFQVDFGEHLVSGITRLTDQAALTRVLADVRTAEGSAPRLVGDGYTLLGVQQAAAQVAAEATIYFGPPGGHLGADSTTITIRRFREPVDVALRAGIWDESATINGREIQLGFMSVHPAWYPTPLIEVTAQAAGRSMAAQDVLANLVEVDERTFADQVVAIEAAVDDPVVEFVGSTSITFPSGIEAVLFGVEDNPRGICLAVDTTRRCDFALMTNAVYTDDGRDVGFFDIQLLVDQRWFTVGLRTDTTTFPVPDGSEVATDGDRTYYVIERPADVVAVDDAMHGSSPRPLR